MIITLRVGAAPKGEDEKTNIKQNMAMHLNPFSVDLPRVSAMFYKFRRAVPLARGIGR